MRGARHLTTPWRVALYYAPELDDPLWAAGCEWLGRNPGLSTNLTQPSIPGIGEVTRAARGYGFHATLKPPMRLATTYAQFSADVHELAAATQPFELPSLAVTDLSGFLAICETKPSLALQAFADSCVAWVDRHREAATPDELRRRRGLAGLSREADRLLLRWGYPDVFHRWRFHMTLTHRLAEEARAMWQNAAVAHFVSAFEIRRGVHSLCVFTQAAPDAPFLLAERVSLGAG